MKTWPTRALPTAGEVGRYGRGKFFIVRSQVIVSKYRGSSYHNKTRCAKLSARVSAMVALAILSPCASWHIGSAKIAPNFGYRPRLTAPAMAGGSLTFQPDFFGDDEEPGNPSVGADTWVPASLVTNTVRDPYKVAQRVLPILLLHVLWSCAIVCVRLLPTRRIPKPWSVSPLLHSLLGGVLGLLLAFRTNQAFSRYWSAAQAWADVHKVAHNFARLASPLAAVDASSYATLMRHLSEYMPPTPNIRITTPKHARIESLRKHQIRTRAPCCSLLTSVSSNLNSRSRRAHLAQAARAWRHTRSL